MRPQQLFFPSPDFRRFKQREHGGEIARGERKRARPLDPKKPLHLVLRSTRAKGAWSFLRARHENRVKHLIYTEGERQGVRIYRYANAGNHLHLVVYAKHRADLSRFLRVIAGLIARVVTGARKGNPVGKFWDRLVYSRIVEWGKDLARLKSYLDLNALESLGWVEFSPRKRKACAAGPPE